MIDNLDLQDILPYERIWLWRRRQENTNGRTRGRGGRRMSANEAAAFLSVPVGTYCAAEQGDITASVSVIEALEALKQDLSFEAEPGELCALARRRSRVEVEDICRGLGGISKPTFFARENNGEDELTKFWEARGYTF